MNWPLLQSWLLTSASPCFWDSRRNCLPPLLAILAFGMWAASNLNLNFNFNFLPCRFNLCDDSDPLLSLYIYPSIFSSSFSVLTLPRITWLKHIVRSKCNVLFLCLLQWIPSHWPLMRCTTSPVLPTVQSIAGDWQRDCPRTLWQKHLHPSATYKKSGCLKTKDMRSFGE